MFSVYLKRLTKMFNTKSIVTLFLFVAIIVSLVDIGSAFDGVSSILLLDICLYGLFHCEQLWEYILGFQKIEYTAPSIHKYGMQLSVVKKIGDIILNQPASTFTSKLPKPKSRLSYNKWNPLNVMREENIHNIHVRNVSDFTLLKWFLCYSKVSP